MNPLLRSLVQSQLSALNSKSMKVAVIGAGNVGIAIATDLSIKGHDVTLLKTSSYKSEAFDRLIKNNNRVFLKEKSVYTGTTIKEVSKDLGKVADAEIIFCTIQSNFYEGLVERIHQYLSKGQIVVCICSYASSYYFEKKCRELPMLVEATGPYLEGRVELNDKPDEVVFRVGCRLERCPFAFTSSYNPQKKIEKLHNLCNSFKHEYSILESALLNPNMVLHTVGSIMSLSRIEYSKGNFCMYREAYTRNNKATLDIMLKLDEEKKTILKYLHQRPIDIFKAGGFLGENKLESFYRYSESNDRAISPTSVHSRYITEDVSEGLVLMESIANHIGLELPVASSLITLASIALGIDFRKTGRTIQKLGIENEIDMLHECR